MSLPSINVGLTVPSGWADNEPYTVKVWRDGSIRSVHHYTSLREAVSHTEAQIRVLNAGHPHHLSWYQLGQEVKLAPEGWREGHTVAYVTNDRVT